MKRRMTQITSEDGEIILEGRGRAPAEQEKLETEVRHIAVTLQRAENAIWIAKCNIEWGLKEPAKDSYRSVMREETSILAIRMAAIELVAALQNNTGRKGQLTEKVRERMRGDKEVEDAWKRVKEYRDKKVAHKTEMQHDYREYAEGEIVSGHSLYKSGWKNEAQALVDVTMVGAVARGLLMEEYLAKRKAQVDRGNRTPAIGEGEDPSQALWERLTLGESIHSKIGHSTATVHLDGTYLRRALKGTAIEVLAKNYEVTTGLLHPLRSCWVHMAENLKQSRGGRKKAGVALANLLSKTDAGTDEIRNTLEKVLWKEYKWQNVAEMSDLINRGMQVAKKLQKQVETRLGGKTEGRQKEETEDNT